MTKQTLIKPAFTLFSGIWLLLLSVINQPSYATEQPKKMLIVISSDSHGYWLPEVVEPYRLFKQAGLHIDIASPKGGRGEASGSFRLSSDDKMWLNKASLKHALAHSLALETIDPLAYQAVYFAGGAGPMFDFVNDAQVHRVIREVYENGGLVSADCHGPAALLNVFLSNGQRLVEGRKITAKANSEEGRWARSTYPFLLENKFKAIGAEYSSASKGKPHVVVDGQLITGQNPASAIPMAKAVISALSN